MGFRGKLKRSKQEEHGESMKFRVHDPLLKNFKRVFAGEPDKYDKIIATLHEFRSESIYKEHMKRSMASGRSP